jgi:tetratricopeptide (TPR) repeat protein
MTNTLLDKAADRCNNHRCEEAVDLLEEAVRQQPANSDLHYRLGICHSGGCRHNGRTNPDLAVEYLRHALSLTASAKDSLVCAGILDALGNAYVYSRQLPKQARMEAALECHRTASELYLSREQLDDWAREEYNQGNAWCELPEEGYPDKWQQAIMHYEQSLRIRTRDKNPLRYAATLQNLGTAYRQLKTGDKTANVLKATDCYRRALQVYDLASFPVQHAALHNNFGNAYLSLAMVKDGIKQRCAQHALEHLNRALRVRTRAEYPEDYAVTQYNRGQAFLLLITDDPQDGYVKAVACFQEAHDCFLLCGHAISAKAARQQVQRVRQMAANHCSRHAKTGS